MHIVRDVTRPTLEKSKRAEESRRASMIDILQASLV